MDQSPHPLRLTTVTTYAFDQTYRLFMTDFDPKSHVDNLKTHCDLT